MTTSVSTKSIAIDAAARRERPLSTSLRQFLGRTRMAAKFVLGQQTLDPGVETFDDDVWYVSFPRSGNTYWRFLTANLISQGEPVDWTNIERFSPDIYITFDSTLRKLPRPRYIKSHEPFKPAYLTSRADCPRSARHCRIMFPLYQAAVHHPGIDAN